MLQPKKTKYRKMMKGRMKGTETRGTKLEFGSYALQALEPLDYQQADRGCTSCYDT